MDLNVLTHREGWGLPSPILLYLLDIYHSFQSNSMSPLYRTTD